MFEQPLIVAPRRCLTCVPTPPCGDDLNERSSEVTSTRLLAARTDDYKLDLADLVAIALPPLMLPIRGCSHLFALLSQHRDVENRSEDGRTLKTTTRLLTSGVRLLRQVQVVKAPLCSKHWRHPAAP